MNATGHGIEDSRDVENVYHMRLMALLRELVRNRGYKGTARVLEVDPETVAESAKTGRLSRRVRDSLERALQEGVGSAAARQRERNEKLEARIEALEQGREAFEQAQDELGKELRRRMASIEGEIAGLRSDEDSSSRGTGAGHAGAGPEQEDAGGPGRGSRRKFRREYPDLATLEPADDDEEVFGDAWSLIARWRELKESHPNEGKGFDWLMERERLLEMELELLEEHGMTLPPEKQPLHGLDRSGQVSWRRTALFDTRRALRKWERWRQVWRVLTLRVWRRRQGGC